MAQHKSHENNRIIATLRGGVWTVTGSPPRRMPGGAAIAEIFKQDGRILRVSHSK
jgi:hypothetical protein